MQETKLKLLEIAIMLVKENLVDDTVLNVYLELREEILEIPRKKEEKNVASFYCRE